jgi:streptogramin lyase
MAAVLASLLIGPSASGAAQTTSLVELAGGLRARALAAGPDGNMWFAGFNNTRGPRNLIGRISSDGQVAEFPVPGSEFPEVGVPAIAAGPDGNLWFTKSTASKIGRISVSGDITEYPLSGTGRQPSAITAGPDGNMWFTEEAVSQIGRITPTGAIAEFRLPIDSAPAGIAAGPDGNLWFTEKGTNKIGRITPSGEVVEYPLPGTASLPKAITAGPDGNMWFTEGAVGQIGRITPHGTIKQFRVPVKTGTGAIASGPAGDIWFTAGGEIGSIAPDGKTDRPNCTPAGCSFPPISLAVDHAGDLWFGADTEETREGGGGTHIISLNAGGWVGKFFPPPMTVAIGSARPVAGKMTDLRLRCDGGAAGAMCKGVLRLTKRIPSSQAPHGAKTLTLSRSRYALPSGEGRRVLLHLTRKAMKLLSRRRLAVQATAVAHGRVEAAQSVLLVRR